MFIRKNLIHEPTEGLTCISPSRTVQEFKDECDVNNILRNYVNTGVLTHTSGQIPVFGDFSQMPSDYGEAVMLIEESKKQFLQLPSNIRERFDNDPLNLVKFLQNSNNRKEAEELGIVNKREDAKEELKD